MVLGELSVQGRSTYLDNSRTKAYCACSWCAWGYLDIFSLVCHFPSRPIFSLSLGDGPIFSFSQEDGRI